MTRPPEPSPAAARAAVERARAGLLGGRGPGASQAEITRYTRARLRMGGRPTPDVRAELAERTARASGDVEAVATYIAERVDAVGDTIAVMRHRADPVRLAGRVRVGLAPLALAVFLTIVVTAVVIRRGGREAR